MTSSSKKLSLCCVFVLLSSTSAADEAAYEFGGHTKLRLLGQAFPENSVFHELAGSHSTDIDGGLRLKFEADKGRWSFDSAYQLIALYGDSIEYSRDLPSVGGVSLNRLPNDERRLFDLTHVIYDEDKAAILHRLDRLWVSYSSEKAVVRFGRQALTWGNGLFYSPMDLVNPFDPAAIDTEYKVGDDMLYGQYLSDSGADMQGAVVFRRDLLSGDVESDKGTVALKYHGFAGETEYDLLAATSYDDPVIGVGVVRSIGGALFGGDLVVTETTSDTYLQAVANLSYFWMWGSKNVSGTVEYYFNGFGQHDGQYDPISLLENPDLLLRVSRGEMFTLGRNYAAGSLMIELTPLWTVTPTMLLNIDDPSALFQLITQYSLGDNTTLLGSLNIPLGRDGTEFGGAETGIPDLYLSRGAGFFAQFAFYF